MQALVGPAVATQSPQVAEVGLHDNARVRGAPTHGTWYMIHPLAMRTDAMHATQLINPAALNTLGSKQCGEPVSGAPPPPAAHDMIHDIINRPGPACGASHLLTWLCQARPLACLESDWMEGLRPEGTGKRVRRVRHSCTVFS